MMNVISRFQKRIVIYIVNHFLVGTKLFKIKRILLTRIGWKIGSNTKIVGPIDCTGTITTGSNCWIGKDLRVYGNGTVNIGSNCDLGPGISFLTGGHTIGDKNRRAGEGVTYSITVKDGVWIGANSTIYGDITINESSVIGACSCVNKSVEPNVVIGGVPAKIIKYLE